MRKSLIQKIDSQQGIKFQFLSLVLISLVCAILNLLPNANASANPLEVLSITEVSDTSVEILFNAKISKSKLKHYVVTATFDPQATNIPEGTNLNSSNLIGSSVKKVLKVKSTGLISTKLDNLLPKAPYIFTVSAKMNQGKLITSESINYLPLSNLMDVVSNLPADWGNPKPIQLPTPAPLAAPAFTLSSSSETRTVNTAATGFTVSSTGGAIASFAISATPPGMSFNTSTGALTGTPNTVAGPTVYTITATNASGSATQTFTLTVAIVAPAFTLSSASESKTVNTAITGYTISSTGGTIASYAISPAAPAGLTFNTTTGLLSGTPTTVAGATDYTITATNASGSATQTFTLTVTAVVYTVGQTGPGGGTIFYVAATPFTCGPTLNLTCSYLEAAPTSNSIVNYWTDVRKQWGDNLENNGDYVIGSGYKNTLAMITPPTGSTTADRAGILTRNYRGPNNLDDWFLPSKDELNALYQARSSVTGLVTSGGGETRYWSSSKGNSASRAERQYFQDGNGNQYTDFKTGLFYIRPIRAF